jgi:GT2 family glycosyltransferase
VHFETPPNAASPATTERHFTLVTNDTIFPDPAWIGALIEAARTGSEPAGARLIGTDGRHIHAGLTDDARPIGFGDPGGFPLLSADRTGTRLAPPYVVSGIDAGTREMRGRIVGSALAVGTPVQDPPGPVASFTDVFGETVLFIGGAAPGRGDADWESAITKAAFRLIEAGMTVAYQWDPDELPPDPRHLALWSAAGVVTVPPPDPRLLSDQFLPDAMAPRSDALALALDPVAVVCLSRASVASDFVLIADRAPAAFTAYAGDEELGHLSARLDRCLSVESVADAVLEVRDHPMRVGGEADIPVIAPVAATPGLVSIVIPVYNRWDLTKQCLETIAAHTPEPHEIIIVDNGSTDGTATAAKGAGCLLITNTENLGFPTAVNQGIEAATGEFVCVLNNDTEVTGGWLTALLAALEVPGTAIVGPRSNQIAGLQRVPNAPGMDERGAARRWAAEWTAAAEDRTWQTARLVGFCLLARRETFERVGGFDQGFGIGNYEDDELGNRIQGQGGTLRVADGSVVLHHGSATFKELGLDYASIMHAAARHLGTRTSEVTGVASALILSDASAEKAARAAVSCMYAADRVRIAERSALLSAELAAAAVRGVQVEVINADWTMDQGSKTAIEGLAGSLVVVVGANEQVAADDWGAVRAELESVDGALAAVTPSGPETRVVPPDHDAIELVGTPSVRIARSFRLVPQHTRES